MKQALIFCFLLLSAALRAQHDAHHDSTMKNTVRINITPMLVTGRLASFTAGYERVITPHQSISANIGHLELPPVITTAAGNPVQWVSSLRNTGFIVSADYRFYFKRNRYAIPDGLYWGPYAAYYYFDKKARAELYLNGQLQATADIQTYFSMATLGLELGYQFVLGKRWTLDLILIGPGVGFYDLNFIIDADANLQGNPEYYQGIYDALISIFPAIGQLFERQEFDTKGAKSFNGLGYRMVIQVGFRF